MYKRSFKERLRRSLEGCSFNLELALILFGDDTEFCLSLFGYLIPLPFLDRWAYEPEELLDKWGFTYFDQSIHLNWKNKCKVIWLPWMWEQVSHEVFHPEGVWTNYVSSWEKDKQPDGRWQNTYPYRYVTESGDVQEVNATIYVERQTYKWRWFKWSPQPKSVYRGISVSFDDEVGERAGSWKGGTIGCGYEMLPHETPDETLRRMERERKFT